MVIISDLSFTKPFSVSYLRNNRSSGQKSLRCFPQCTEKGHIASGFCGDHLEATATIEKNPELGDNWLEQISVLGEIRPFSDQGISSGNKVSRRKLLNDLRDTQGTKSGGELLLGEMRVLHENELTAVVIITFNAEKHSWDYSWKSNRWSGVNNSHVVDVVLVQSLTYGPAARNNCVDPTDDNLDVYSNACGATFLILSSHKSPHLKRKLSAAAATAADETGSVPSTEDAALPLIKLEPKRRSSLNFSSDPMSALLMALTEGDRQEGDSLPADTYIDSSDTQSTRDTRISSKGSVFYPSSSGLEEPSPLPAKRKRMKSMKMKEYSDCVEEEEGGVGGALGDDEHCESTMKAMGFKAVQDKLGDLQKEMRLSYSGVSGGSGGGSVDCEIHTKGEHGNDTHRYSVEDEYQEEGGGDMDYDYEAEHEYGSSIVTKKKKCLNSKATDDDLSSCEGPCGGFKDLSSKEDLQSADSKVFDLRWNETFVELVTYCETFGHGNVPKDYKSAGGRWLGKWLDFQRQMKKKNRLRADRVTRLECLVNDGYLNMYDGPRRGHRLSGENVHQWEGWYNALLEYGEINGTYNVPRHYVIPASTSSSSAVTLFNTVGRKLGRWLQTQRLRGRSGDLRGDRLMRLQELADTGRLDWHERSKDGAADIKEEKEGMERTCEREGEREGERTSYGEDEGDLTNMSSSRCSSAASSSSSRLSLFPLSLPLSIPLSLSEGESLTDILSKTSIEREKERMPVFGSHGDPPGDQGECPDRVVTGGAGEGSSRGRSTTTTIAATSSVKETAPSAVAIVRDNRNGVGVQVGGGVIAGVQGVITGGVSAFKREDAPSLCPHSPLSLNGLEALLFAATSH